MELLDIPLIRILGGFAAASIGSALVQYVFGYKVNWFRVAALGLGIVSGVLLARGLGLTDTLYVVAIAVWVAALIGAFRLVPGLRLKARSDA